MRTILAPLLFVFVFACASPRTDHERRELVVACDFDHEPFSSLSTTGEPVGRDVDMMRLIAKRLDRVLVWKRMPFDDLLTAAATYRVDVVCATLGITEERAREVDFTRPYYRTEIAVVVPSHGITSLAELADSRIAAAPQTTAARAVELEWPEATLVLVSEREGLALLLRGEIDAVVTDRPDAVRLVERAADSDLSVLPEALAEELYALVLPPDSGLLEPLDEALEALERSGELERLDEKHEL